MEKCELHIFTRKKITNLENNLIALEVYLFFATGAAAGEKAEGAPGCNNLHNKSVSLKVCVYYVVVVCELAVLFLLF